MMFNQTEKELELRRTVLIVDDEEINRDILASFVEDTFDVLFASNGKEALEQLEKNKDKISIVLLDFIMPIMTGRDVLQVRQKTPDYKKIPFIVVTGEKTVEIECFKLGVNDFIKKPFDNPEIIVARINRMIELYEDRSIIKEVKRDKLTNLFSRDFFKQYCVKFDEKYVNEQTDMLSISITRFHLVNEIFGRVFADNILKDMAVYLKENLADAKAIVGRESGDRFLVYCLHQEDYSDFINSLVEHINKLTNTNSVRIRVGLYPNVDKKEDKDIIIGRTVNAEQSIKNDLNSVLAVYDHTIQEKAKYYEELINSVDESIKNKDFKIFYQPKYSIQGEKNVLSSAEALIRWVHPKYGMISPGEFIPLFENNGIIRKIDDYVLKEVALQIDAWHKEFGRYFPVSVNISRVDIFDNTLESRILTYVDKLNIPHNCYYIEITESAYSNNANQIIDLSKSLRNKGFLVEVDDFGTGYSSLAMLTEVPFDVLKIDMKFIRGIDKGEKEKEMVKFIVNIVKQFKSISVAEGVETEAHYKFLKEIGCDIIQGYYFSKPLNANEFSELIKKEFI